ncbi:hypothetical protein BCR42DRAFT_421717 [Absidia repens]|uniref:Uncharacterized protein n=1 Tax=Absidia repens TaxID=90262 RepID=A0A1X2I7S2_9FUNG|nr:hypothetical protein BCR42DRAFT_421717 [Absidia repens]
MYSMNHTHLLFISLSLYVDTTSSCTCLQVAGPVRYMLSMMENLCLMDRKDESVATMKAWLSYVCVCVVGNPLSLIGFFNRMATCWEGKVLIEGSWIRDTYELGLATVDGRHNIYKKKGSDGAESAGINVKGGRSKNDLDARYINSWYDMQMVTMFFIDFSFDSSFLYYLLGYLFRMREIDA